VHHDLPTFGQGAKPTKYGSSIFYDVLSVTRLYSVYDRAISE
jgi:hypothetical protein